MKIILRTHYAALGAALAAFCLMLAVYPAGAQSSEKATPGHFYLVSVGVGDPDLITVRAIESIQKSDIIICRPDERERFGT